MSGQGHLLNVVRPIEADVLLIEIVLAFVAVPLVYPQRSNPSVGTAARPSWEGQSTSVTGDLPGHTLSSCHRSGNRLLVEDRSHCEFYLCWLLLNNCLRRNDLFAGSLQFCRTLF